MNINVIGVPLFYGCDRKGVDLSPNKLRENGIIKIIENHNHNVYDMGNIYVPEVSEEDKYAEHSKMKYLKEIVDVNKNLAHQVYTSISSGNFPLVIGGDHALGLGSLKGVNRKYSKLAVVWIDAHGDINTHETTPSGNIHGMPLAAAMGIGHENLTSLYYHGVNVDPENVFLIAARDLDEGETKIIKDNKINLYSTNNIKELGIEAIMKDVIDKLKAKDIDAVHLSFDIDCLDSNLVPGTGTPVGDGINISEGKYALKSLLETKLVCSLDFVELNTKLDSSDKTLNLCLDLIDWISEHL
ncbi:arginase [Haloimpatiens lingqiaonensis]|uniref:arginase n=1 Tax=Haloimpatiens lingqiaonensis TaxID=1380675 RepID=UPI0010FEF469|nr:arginase [Haloimpatiens lingqiaonensis]